MENRIEEIYSRIRATKGRIFSARFIKKDGSVRDIVCRLGVKKGLTGAGMRFDPLARNMVPVYDMQKRDYRMINLATLQSIKSGREVFNI